MKKTLFTLLLSLVALTAAAQKTPHAVGVHLGGTTMDLEYRFYFDKSSFLDATAGVFDFDDAFFAQVTYNHDIAKWEAWTPAFAVWKLWGGIGGGIGGYDGGVLFGPTAVLGFGFTPRRVPLTFGVDYRPALVFGTHDGVDVLTQGFRNVGITLTYRF